MSSSRSSGCNSIPYGVLVLTCVYVAVCAFIEGQFPTCVHEDECLDNGVDNSTSTIASGSLVSLAMLAFGIHLLYEKKCHSHVDPVSMNGVRLASTIFHSGIAAQFFMACGVLLQTLARILQPDLSLGNTIYWSCWSTSFVAMTLAIFNHGRFAVQSMKNKESVGCLFSYCCCCSELVLPTFSAAMVILSAGIRCGLKADDDSDSLQVDNIFYQGSSQQGDAFNEAEDVESTIPFEREHTCQDIVHYATYIFYVANFLFWVSASRKLRKATRLKEDELMDNSLVVLGLPTLTAARLVPWVAFTIGSLYPFWTLVASEISDKEVLDVSKLAYEGLVYHYSLLLTAYLAHNMTLTLTFERAILEKGTTKEQDSVFTEKVFNDLTFGIFEKPKASLLDLEDQSDSDSSGDDNSDGNKS